MKRGSTKAKVGTSSKQFGTMEELAKELDKMRLENREMKEKMVKHTTRKNGRPRESRF
jgi:hypothetical protein